jgi:phosphoribosylcarboxyaminoimidazole (NCAIR) mutase
MNKVLFLASASEKDPGFEGTKVNGQDYRDYFKSIGVYVVEQVIESCHGCPDIMDGYSQQLEQLVDEGKQVVSILQGGLYFALPSLQATQTTIPIISVPTDLVAYQAFMVPSGHAAIATVGVEREGEYTQRNRAFRAAAYILYDPTGVSMYGEDKKCENKLQNLGIVPQEDKELSVKLTSQFNHRLIESNGLCIRTDFDEDMNDWAYLARAEGRHHDPVYQTIPNLQVRGSENMAIFAAKIMGQYNPDIRKKVQELGPKKRDTYNNINAHERRSLHNPPDETQRITGMINIIEEVHKAKDQRW